MRVVHKYPLSPGLNSVVLPHNAKIVHVGEQHGALFIWVECDPTRGVLQKTFYVRATGEYMYDDNEHHVGTIQLDNGIVWHVYSVF